MTDEFENHRVKDTISEAEWAHILGEAPEDIAVDAISSEQNNDGNWTGGAKGEGDYIVGRGRPPEKHRFRKGRSGNLKGRPKGTKNLKTDLVEELSERVKVTENGRKLTVSKQRLIIKVLTAKAVKGDTKAANILINLLAQTMGLDSGPDAVKDLSAEDTAILSDFTRRQTEPGNG